MNRHEIIEWVCPFCGYVKREKFYPMKVHRPPVVCPACNDGKHETYKSSPYQTERIVDEEN